MKFTKKADLLWEECRATIISNVISKGVESKFCTEKVLSVNCDILLDGYKLVEIGEDVIINEDGLRFSYGTLNLNQLTELADVSDT